MKLFAKRMLCLAIATILCLGVLSGCGEKKGSDVVTFLLTGSEMPDTLRMQEKVKQIVKEKLGITLEYQVVSPDAYDLAISSGDPIDLIQAPNWNNFWGNAQKGAFMEITDEDLKENAPYIWENGQDFIKYTTYQGKRYGIPAFHIQASDRCFVARGDLMEKYGIPDLNSIENIEKFLDAVKAGEPGMIPLDIKGGAGFHNLILFAADWGWAPVGSLSYAEHVYYDLDDPEHKLFIAAETPEMLMVTKKMKEWNEKGYFSKSVLSNKTASLDSFKAGRTALAFINNPQACQALWDEVSKDERKSWNVKFYPRYQQRQQQDTPLSNNISISAFSQNKANALKVLDLMLSDKELNQLMCYGEEGVHYTLDEDGYFTETEKFYDVGPLSGGVFNDAYKLEVRMDFPGHEELTKRLADMVVVNPTVSMPTDDTNVRAEKVALREVYNQYSLPRMYGVFEGTAEEALKREVEALKTAGIDKYMADLQKQVDAYFKELGE